MSRKDEDRPLTVMILPHGRRSPISLRITPWMIRGAVAVAAIMLSVMANYALDYAAERRGLEQRLAELKAERQYRLARQAEMKDTVLAQRQEIDQLNDQLHGDLVSLARQIETYEADLTDEVETFESGVLAEVAHFKADVQMEVNDFEAQLNQIDRLSTKVQGLIGEEPATAEAQAASFSDSRSRIGGLATFVDEANPYLGSEISRPEDNAKMMDAFAGIHNLRDLRSTLPGKLAELEQLKAEVSKRLERIDSQKRRDQDQLERELRLMAVAPTEWPVQGRITSEFGYRTVDGRRDFHSGLDIGVWFRTPVRASKAGVVTAAGWRGGLGWMVELRHEQGFSTLYAHLYERPPVTVGEKVEEGQVIGRSGSSGHSTGPHLHYELQLWGTSIDPMKYLDLDK